MVVVPVLVFGRARQFGCSGLATAITLRGITDGGTGIVISNCSTSGVCHPHCGATVAGNAGRSCFLSRVDAAPAVRPSERAIAVPRPSAAFFAVFC